MTECQQKIKELREITGMNRRQFCEAFEIPIWLLFYKSESNSFITKSEYILINNFSNLSVTGKRLLLELSENLK